MNIVKQYINYLCIIPFIMVLATVFVIDNEMENGVVSGKYVWFYLSMGLITITTTLSYLIKSNPIRITFGDILLLSFCAVGLLSSYYITQSINTRFVLFLLSFILYINFRIVLSQYNRNRFILILFFIVTGLIEGIWGFKQLYGLSASQHNLFKLTGSFFNPGPYAGYLALIAPMALYYVLKDYRVLTLKFKKSLISFYVRGTISFITLLCIMSILPAAMSRASWLGAFGGCICVGVLFLSQQKKAQNYIRDKQKRIMRILFLIALILPIACFSMYELKKDSADGRFLMWKISFQMISKHPFGVGIGNFPGSYGDAQAAYFASGHGSEQEKHVAGSPEYAFNEYLQICNEQGIASFVLFMASILYTLYWGITKKRFAEIGSLVSLLIFAFMSYPFSILPFVIAFTFLLATSASVAVKSQNVFSLNPKMSIALLCLSTAIVALCLYNRYPTHKAYKEWYLSKMLYTMKYYTESAREYKKLEPLLNDQTKFMFEYAQSLSQIGDYTTSNAILYKAMKISCDPMLYNVMGKNYQAIGEYNLAEEYYIKSTNITPSRLYPYYLLAKLYDEMGDEVKSCETAQIVLTKEPKVHSKAVEEMRDEMKAICVNNKNETKN